MREMESFLDRDCAGAVPKSLLGKAITYFNHHRAALNRFLEDGRLAPDTGAVERLLRIVAIGRNNWLFVGSNEGGRRAAIVLSLIAICRLHEVEPWAYLRDVFDKLARGWPASRVRELLPDVWGEHKGQETEHKASPQA